MDPSQSSSLLFRPLLALNLPLQPGAPSGSSSSGTSTPIEPSSVVVIDLTSDDSNTAHIVPHQIASSTPLNQDSVSHDRSDNHDDDIIFTGHTLPPTPHPARTPPPGAEGDPQSPESLSAQRGTPRMGLRGRIADLTAGIYAGYFSSNPSTVRNNPIEQGPSAITIRDSPPLQVRRLPRAPRVNFGGGGRFSGGQFSGLVATGLSGIRGLAAGARYITSSGDTLQEMFANWNRNGRRANATSFPVDESRQFVPWELDTHLLAVFGFDGPLELHTPAPVVSDYKESDSHPLKIKSGFSKEIIPLDREIFALDNDTPDLQAVKQDSRPICACCSRDLLIGQDSTVDGKTGRRPWILRCGHVVDSQCLELATSRAREEKRQKSLKGKSGRGSTSERCKSKRPTESVLHLEFSPSPSGKRRKISQVPQGNLGRNKTQHPTPLKSDTAVTRQERAKAREARKSMEQASAQTFPSTSKAAISSEATGGAAESDVPNSFTATSKGKGRAQDEPLSGKVKLASPSIAGILVPCEGSNSSVQHSTWTRCPVKGCQGPKGDLLAAPGSKMAPWEMFV